MVSVLWSTVVLQSLIERRQINEVITVDVTLVQVTRFASMIWRMAWVSMVLGLPAYCIVINCSLLNFVIEMTAKWIENSRCYCTITFCVKHIFGCFYSIMIKYDLVKLKLVISVMFVAFKSHREWSNAKHVSTPTTTILPSTVGDYFSTNCFNLI